jgi:hypothetical protein
VIEKCHEFAGNTNVTDITKKLRREAAGSVLKRAPNDAKFPFVVLQINQYIQWFR